MNIEICDISDSLDEGSMAAIALLDLPAAYNAIEHSLLRHHTI